MVKGEKYYYKKCKFRNGKRAFVDFWAFDLETNSLKKKRVFCPANITGKARELWGKQTSDYINGLLEKGLHFPKQQSEEPAPELVISQRLPEVTIVEAIEKALPIKLAELRGASKDSYDSTVNKFKRYLASKGLEKAKVKTFDYSNVIEYRAHLINDLGNVNRTANNNIINLGALFEIIKTLKFIDVDPFEKVKGLPEQDTEIHEVFTKEHQTILEDWMIQNDPILYLFTRFQYHAFIRPKEIKALQVKDINLERRTIVVSSGIAKNKKNGIVPINQTLYQDYLSILATYQNKALPNNLIFGKLLTLFVKEPLSENYAYNRHCRALEACHLTEYEYTLYSWKHTGACRAIEAGVNVRKLQGLLRHSSLEETDRYLRSLGISLQNEKLNETW